MATYQDASGTIDLRRRPGLVFEHGHDFPLLQAMKRIGYFDRSTLPAAASLTVDTLLRAGQVSRCHVLDVRADDPLGFKWAFYGEDARFCATAFRNLCVGDHPSSLLKQYACGEYSRIKTQGVPDLTEVDIDANWSRIVFRRLILPFGERGEVTHFLIFFTSDLSQIGRRSGDQVVPAARQSVHN